MSVAWLKKTFIPVIRQMWEFLACVRKNVLLSTNYLKYIAYFIITIGFSRIWNYDNFDIHKFYYP